MQGTPSTSEVPALGFMLALFTSLYTLGIVSDELRGGIAPRPHPCRGNLSYPVRLFEVGSDPVFLTQ
jgi:hypothetical protein